MNKCKRCGATIDQHPALAGEAAKCQNCGYKNAGSKITTPMVLGTWLGSGLLTLCFVSVFIAVGQTDQPSANSSTTQSEALDTFLQLAEKDGIRPLVKRFSVDGNTLTIAVDNFWHSQPKQMRLQAAQNLWACWAQARSPSSVDTARLKITDLNGNVVGGSRTAGGSMLWVD